MYCYEDFKINIIIGVHMKNGGEIRSSTCTTQREG